MRYCEIVSSDRIGYAGLDYSSTLGTLLCVLPLFLLLVISYLPMQAQEECATRFDFSCRFFMVFSDTCQYWMGIELKFKYALSILK